MMAHYGTLQDYRFTDTDAAKDDIRGSKIYGRDDEKLGKIDDVIFDHSTGAIRNIAPTTAQMTQGTGATGPMVGETSGRSMSSSPTGVGSEISTDTPEEVAR